MPNDAAVAAPSAAASEPQFDVPTDAEGYAEWRISGNLPPKTEAPAASKPQPEKRSSETHRESEAAPDPESGRQEHAGKRGKLSARERSEQLRSENEELERQLERRRQLRRELESPDDKTEPKKTATSAAKPADNAQPQELKPPVRPVKPKKDDFDTWEKYEAAKDKYDDDIVEYGEKLSEYRAEKAIQDERVRQMRQRQLEVVAKNVEDAKKIYPDLDGNKIDEAAGTIFEDQKIPLVIKKMVGGSSVMAHLLYVLSSDQAKFNQFLELARRDDVGAIRELSTLEGLVREELANGKSKSKTSAKPSTEEEPESEEADETQEETEEIEEEEEEQTPRNSRGQFTKPQKPGSEKRITAAPPPPEEVGTRGSKPPDPVETAAKNGDFRAFKRAQDAKDLARRRGL